jgi:phasin family protein
MNMNLNVDQLSKATKSQIESQLQAVSGLAEHVMHTVSGLVELNIATVKASLEDMSAVSQEVMAAKDPQAALAVLQAHAQPSADKAMSYARHVAAIASKTQAEMADVAKARAAETSAHVHALINDLTKAAPAGTEPFVDAVKQGVANANAAYEQFIKVAQSSYDKYQEQLHEMGGQFAPVSKAAAKAKKAAA